MRDMAALTPLCELARKFKTDKGHPHGYTVAYYQILKDRADSVTRIMEIGIRTGGSLRMWEAFFPHAAIFGVDRNPAYFLNEGRIQSYFGNQAKTEKLTRLAKDTLGGHPFDVIVDDGSHQPDKQISAMGALLPFLRDNGFYFIEDIRHEADIGRIRSRLPMQFQSHPFVGGKVHPKYGPEQMLIIWRPKHTAPDLDGLGA